MAETLVENRICYACGVDVRPGALFCYNCGKIVAPEIPVETKNKNLSNTWVHQNVEEIKQESKAEAEESDGQENKEPKEKTTKKPELQEYIKLNSAASMRRKPKTIQKKQIEEVIWEEHENAPNLWFILVAFLLTLFAAGVFYLAKYLG